MMTNLPVYQGGGDLLEEFSDSMVNHINNYLTDNLKIFEVSDTAHSSPIPRKN